jgi:CBS-domain-containing membrane protein
MEIPQVTDCMAPEPTHCFADTDLAQAAHLLWTRDCGVLPVIDATYRVVGVVTDRDLLMCAYTTGRPLGELHVKDCMSSQVRTCSSGDDLRDVMRVLADARVRRLPVVDEDGLLCGLLSINDVVHAVETLDDARTRARLLEDLLATLAAIGVPRGPRRARAAGEIAPARPSAAARAKAKAGAATG